MMMMASNEGDSDDDPRKDLNGLFAKGSSKGAPRQYVVQSRFSSADGVWKLGCIAFSSSAGGGGAAETTMTTMFYEAALTHEETIAHMQALNIAGDALGLYCARVRRAFLQDGLLATPAADGEEAVVLTAVCFVEPPASRQVTHVYRLRRCGVAAAAAADASSSASSPLLLLGDTLDALVDLSVRAHVAERELLRSRAELAAVAEADSYLSAIASSSTSPAAAVSRSRRGGGRRATSKSSTAAAAAAVPVVLPPSATLAKRRGWGLVNPTSKRQKPMGAKIVQDDN